MAGMLRGRVASLAAVLVAAAVGAVLLVPMHPEAGTLRLLGSVLPSGALAGGSPGWWALEDTGNVALFVPVGLVAARFLRPVHALVAGVAVSAICETAQLVIPSRNASLQDVLMNSIGVLVGVAAVVVVRGARRSIRLQASATSPHSVQAQ